MVPVLLLLSDGCAYPMLTHTVVPDSGFVIGGGGAFIAGNDGKHRTIPLGDPSVFVSGGWGGADDAGGALRITGEATVGSGLTADLYGKLPGRPLATDVGLGVMGLFTSPRHGVLPYAMIGWPIGAGLLSVAEGVAITADSTRHARVLVTTIAYQPPNRFRDYVQLFGGFALGRQEPGCYSNAVIRSSCWVPFAWLGTSFDFHPRARDFDVPRRRR